VAFRQRTDTLRSSPARGTRAQTALGSPPVPTRSHRQRQPRRIRRRRTSSIRRVRDWRARGGACRHGSRFQVDRSWNTCRSLVDARVAHSKAIGDPDSQTGLRRELRSWLLGSRTTDQTRSSDTGSRKRVLAGPQSLKMIAAPPARAGPTARRARDNPEATTPPRASLLWSRLSALLASSCRRGSRWLRRLAIRA
jgi:hypothetical protein